MKKGRCEGKKTKCRRQTHQCRLQVYNERSIIRWMKIAACKCLDQQENEDKNQKQARYDYCRTWNDMNSVNYGFFHPRKTKVVKAIIAHVANENQIDNLESCQHLLSVENIFGVQFFEANDGDSEAMLETLTAEQAESVEDGDDAEFADRVNTKTF